MLLINNIDVGILTFDLEGHCKVICIIMTIVDILDYMNIIGDKI